MEWQVKKSRYVKQRERYVLLLTDLGGSLKMIAQASASVAVNPGDLLSPQKDAQYCINREKTRTIKIIDANPYTSEEWERLMGEK